MNYLYYKPAFFKDLEKKIKDKIIRKQIINKTLALEHYAPIGKKLVDCPYWSVHVNKYRIIYSIDKDKITFLRIFLRKHNYKELKKL